MEVFEGSQWLVIGICVIGVLLAYVTDEGYSLLIPGGTTPSRSTVKKTDEDDVSTPSTSAGTPTVAGDSSSKERSDLPPSVYSHAKYVALAMSAPLRVTLCQVGQFTYRNSPPSVQKLMDGMLAKITKAGKMMSLYFTSLKLKRAAKSRRHFFYLMEKQILGLDIKQEETEVDSYLDCKRHLGSKWPFMWEVADVKSAKIQCAGHECVPMSSYSYLDLVRDSSVQAAAIAAAQKWSSGNHGPRMLGGNTAILCDLERRVSRFFNREATLLCVSGYQACFSACVAVSHDRAALFGDNRLHASSRAGMKCGQGKNFWFKHNDFGDLERLLKLNRHKYTDAWIIIESVYSMDGDIADLHAVADLAKRYNCHIMLDEAHGLGVLGKTGRGLEEHVGLQGVSTLLIGTFSKSAASIGGYITGPQKLISYMDFHAPGNVFSAPLPAYCAGAVIRALEIIDEQPEVVQRAQSNSKRLRELLVGEFAEKLWPASYPEVYKYKLEGDPATCVLPLIFYDDIDRVMRVADVMKQRGYMLSAVAYPACPLREPRFRLTATSFYTEELMENFVRTLIEVCCAEGPSALRQALAG